jgi:hypothetical protein
MLILTTSAEEITTGNLLPNNGQSASSAQSVDTNIPKIGNSFSSFTSSNATNFSSEVEVTGTGTLSYSGSLLNITTNSDTTTQDKLNNGITMTGNTIIQNCEWSQSSYACGNRGAGQDSFSTKIQILNSNDGVISETNQIRNNDAGYYSNAFKYTDTLIYNGTGSNKFNWEWKGIDGQSNPGNLGGPNLLGANLFLTYDNTLIEETVKEELTNLEESITEVFNTIKVEEEVKIETTPIVNTNKVQTASLPSKTMTAPVAKTNTTPVSKTNTTSVAKTNTTSTSTTASQTNTQASTSTTASTNNAPKKETKTEKKEEVAKNENNKSSNTSNEEQKENTSTETASKEEKSSEVSNENKEETKTESTEIASNNEIKIDEIKDPVKNLQIKNIQIISQMTDSGVSLESYNIPFYKEKRIYTEQINIFDNRKIYSNITLTQYHKKDPMNKNWVELQRIKKEKEKLIIELEILKNGQT